MGFGGFGGNGRNGGFFFIFIIIIILLFSFVGEESNFSNQHYLRTIVVCDDGFSLFVFNIFEEAEYDKK